MGPVWAPKRVRRGSGGNGCHIEKVHGVNAIVPVFAAERPTRQRELHDVVELSITRKQLQFPVMKYVVGPAYARCDLGSPTEIDRRISCGIRGQIFFVKAHTKV